MADAAAEGPRPQPPSGIERLKRLQAEAAAALMTQAAPPAPAAPKAAEAPARGAVELLLKVEADARRAPTPDELVFLIANETPRVARARQIFVLRAPGGRRPRVIAISGLSQIDRHAPRVLWAQAIVRALAADKGLAAPSDFTLPAYTPKGSEEHKDYPFHAMLWAPLKLGDGTVFAGLLLARDTPWAEADQLIAKRLAETYGHAWAALTGPRKLKRRFRAMPWLAAAGLAGLIVAGFVPVPMSVLSPVKVAAVTSHVVASPLDGIVEEITVEPNAIVEQGDVIARLSDTTLRNEAAVAREELAVAEARLKLVSQAAVNDAKMRRELAVSRADVAVKRARLAYAEDLLARSVVMAPAAGAAVYADRREWRGRPVRTGERMLEIADPSQLELAIEVPVHDSIAIKPGAKVRAFLDSDPLHPLDATVRSASYEAKLLEGGQLAYKIDATIIGTPPESLRLGIRGTAQISGEDVPLAFWLFRRPLTAIRQWLGL